MLKCCKKGILNVSLSKDKRNKYGNRCKRLKKGPFKLLWRQIASKYSSFSYTEEKNQVKILRIFKLQKIIHEQKNSLKVLPSN